VFFHCTLIRASASVSNSSPYSAPPIDLKVGRVGTPPPPCVRISSEPDGLLYGRRAECNLSDRRPLSIHRDGATAKIVLPDAAAVVEHSDRPVSDQRGRTYAGTIGAQARTTTDVLTTRTGAHIGAAPVDVRRQVRRGRADVGAAALRIRVDPVQSLHRVCHTVSTVHRSSVEVLDVGVDVNAARPVVPAGRYRCPRRRAPHRSIDGVLV